MVRATVSGSFRRHMTAIYEAVTRLVESGVEVLSPADPRVVDQIGDFVFVASDRVRSIKLVEDRHLEAIRASDFLWLVAPDGYVGQSASMELGYAVASGTPVFGEVLPTDTTLQKYVRQVPDLYSALAQVRVHRVAHLREVTFLIDPFSTIERAHGRLERIRHMLERTPREVGESGGDEILRERDRIADLLKPVSARARSSRTDVLP
jgi:nucleoside 2-deoxyribosyltransferase